jgi:hypothetical protein
MMEQKAVSDWRMAPVLVGRGRQRARVGEGGEGDLFPNESKWEVEEGIEGIHSITEWGVGICQKKGR